MAQYVKVSSQKELRAARDAFRLLFRNTDLGDQPLRSPGSGVLLWPIRYELTEEQYRPLASAAMAEGDTESYLSYLYGYKGDDGDELSADFEMVAHYRFDLRLFPPRDFGEEWFGMAEHVIYSPRGAWGVLVSLDDYAVAVGSRTFRSTLLEAPVFANSLEGVLEQWKDGRDRLRGRTSWVPALLENVYGATRAGQILAEFREPPDTWLRNG